MPRFCKTLPLAIPNLSSTPTAFSPSATISSDPPPRTRTTTILTSRRRSCPSTQPHSPNGKNVCASPTRTAPCLHRSTPTAAGMASSSTTCWRTSSYPTTSNPSSRLFASSIISPTAMHSPSSSAFPLWLAATVTAVISIRVTVSKTKPPLSSTAISAAPTASSSHPTKPGSSTSRLAPSTPKPTANTRTRSTNTPPPSPQWATPTSRPR